MAKSLGTLTLTEVPKGSGVYRIVSSCGRQYIGSAKNLRGRLSIHQRDLMRGKHHSRFMQRVWNKRGPDSLQFEILLRCQSEHLIWYEQCALDVYKPEFNTAPTAGSQLGYKFSAEAKIKMAEAARRTRNFTGHRHSEETKQRISRKKGGRKNGPHSLETRAKIGSAHKGRIITPEHRLAISRTLTGRKNGPPSEATRAKIAAANRGQLRSPETRARMSAAARRRWRSYLGSTA